MRASRLEVYRHLFASVAEEMGARLMRSAFSSNIKERRDFSCAIFSADGALVAQAAHIPVHLGSTGLCVAAVIERMADEIGPESLPVVVNDPYAGGTHLPDITLVSGVFDEAGTLRFWVANRAHHADVGGISPGSLPLSRHIDEEGIRISPSFLDEAVQSRIAGASRTPEERLGDLNAQKAANRCGVGRLRGLMQRHEELFEAIDALHEHSERFMRSILAQIPDGVASAVDLLDDDGVGTSEIELPCRVEFCGDNMVVDFRDAPDQVAGPVNVPRAVTVSAVYYVLRCLAPRELPTNQGFMRCVRILTRPGSILDARYPAPVSIGNVETSQRVVDVVFRALSELMPGQIPAASCGSMNNVLIGSVPEADVPFAYYETIGGGAGACSDSDGESGIHTHMTNTLNTPVEALEHTFPFRVSSYRIRRGSGGRGRASGGDGVVRSYVFQGPALVTLMTERRVFAPWGLEGGGDGDRGRNLLESGGEVRVLPGKCTFEVANGDRVVLETPGGGGFGAGTSPGDTESDFGRT